MTVLPRPELELSRVRIPDKLFGIRRLRPRPSSHAPDASIALWIRVDVFDNGVLLLHEPPPPVSPPSPPPARHFAHPDFVS